MSLEPKLGPTLNDILSNVSDFDSGFNDQDSASSQQSADSVLSSNSDSRASSLEKSSATDTQWVFNINFW